MCRVICTKICAVIYHILTSADWAHASERPTYAPAGFAADGYIHCCNADQLKYVGDHHFREKPDLLILCIDTAKLNAPVKYEDLNREGMLFPHIYGVLNTDAVKKVVGFPPNADGTFQIPHEITD